MALRDLIPDLLKLSHDEMVQVIKILQDEIGQENQQYSLLSAEYEVWSPQISPETAREILNMIQEDKTTHG
jgi:hypothetical protein